MSQSDIEKDLNPSPLSEWINHFLIGAGITNNKARELGWNALLIASAAGLGFALVLFSTAWILAGADWDLYWRYNLARVLDTIPGGGDITFFGNGFTDMNRTPSEYVLRYHDNYHAAFTLTSYFAVALSTVVFGGIGYFLQKFYVSRGRGVKSKFIRGQALITPEELTAAVEAENAQKEEWARQAAEESGKPKEEFRDFKICGIRIPFNTLQLNVFLTGGMGSGKSNAIKNLLDQMCAYGMTLAIYDKVGELTAKYYRAGIDVIFNPFDARCPGWNIFKEITKTYGFAQISEDLLMVDEKADQGSGKFFNDSARMINEDILLRTYTDCKARGKEPTTEDYTDVLFKMSIDDKYAYLQGLPSAELLAPDAKSRGDIHNTLLAALKGLRYIKSGDFSIREFVRNAGDRRLFLLSKEEVHAPSAPLLALAASILYKEMMNGDWISYPKYGVVLDELASIGNLPILKEACTEARKFGVATIVGAQNINQFFAMYGKEKAATILSNFGHVVMLRVNEAETQELYSKAIGVGEFDEISRGLSWGPQDNKDGATVNSSRKEIRAVLPSEMGLLPANCGYLKIAGAYRVAKVSYSWHTGKTIAEGWVPRADQELSALEAEIAQLREKIIAEEHMEKLLSKNDKFIELEAYGWMFRAAHIATGKCDFKTRTIIMPVAVLNSGNPGLIAYGLAHEMAHAFAGPKAGHGKKFTDVLKKLCSDENLAFEAEYTGETGSSEASAVSETKEAMAEELSDTGSPWTGEDPTTEEDLVEAEESMVDSAIALIQGIASSASSAEESTAGSQPIVPRIR